jgi:hypothetical protein
MSTLDNNSSGALFFTILSLEHNTLLLTVPITWPTIFVNKHPSFTLAPALVALCVECFRVLLLGCCQPRYMDWANSGSPICTADLL